MQLINRTRELYRRVLQGNKPTPQRIDDSIQAAMDFKNLQKAAGWKRLIKWLEINRTGILEIMEMGIKPDPLFGKTRLQKYDDYQVELKVYKKIFKYLEVSIAKGEQYARER